MKRPLPIDHEVPYESGTMISETDLEGTIIYCNRKFARMNGYDPHELIGVTHNILRHPDMPEAVFRDLWSTIQRGERWKGYIKNLRKDGSYYWCVVYISPTLDDEEAIKGYIAIREAPGPQTLPDIKARYEKLRDSEF